MIIPLRKRHFLIWIVLGILLPIMAITAFINVQKIPPSEVTFNKQSPPLPDIKHEAQDEYVKINIRANASGEYQLETIILQPFVSASSLIYLSNSSNPADFDQAAFVGSITAKGVYRFKIPASSINNRDMVNVIFYDKVKENIFENIEVKL
ncbi:MAG: hypothetical protein AAFX87_04655 [Bacteroidota bacterium]